MEVFFLMLGLWVVVAVALGTKRPRGMGGVALRARLDAVYGEPHELVKVSPSAFLEADVEFYVTACGRSSSSEATAGSPTSRT